MAQKRPNKMMRKRIRFLIAAFVAVGFVAVAGRLLYLQVINTAFYQGKASENQTKDSIITPMRGTIYDRNMTELVTSATTQEISVDPSIIRTYGKRSVGKKTDSEGKEREATKEELAAAVEEYQTKVAKLLVKYLGVDEQETLQKIQRDVMYVRIARQVELTTVEDMLSEAKKEGLKGIATTEDSKRYYKYGQFASQLLGFTNSDGEGLYGVEKQYNDQLQGVAGRVVKATNAAGADMPYDYEEYTPAEDGKGVVLTVDEGVQHYLEKHLEEAYDDNEAKYSVCGIVMNVKTGEILGMATKPDFDLNNPRTIPEEYTNLTSQLKDLTGDQYDEKYSELLIDLWKNKGINYTYEPGSTFKVFTVSSALEAGVVTTDDTFYCPGYKYIPDWKKNINCWKVGGHGSESLGQTLENSCNVAMMDIGAKLGSDLFRKYFAAYGLTEKTGIDLVGEETGIFFDSIGETDLATASFGQNFQVTPMQELCMVSAAVNGGELVTPHVMKEIVDSDGNVIQTSETEVKRQVISKDTSEIMAEYLQNVVELGTGQNAYVAGYRVGGKTATTEKQPKGSKNRIASFIGVSPMDDPQYAVLVLIDEPQGSVRGGGAIAAPVVARIFEDILPILGVEPVYGEDEEGREEITVPSLAGSSLEDAKAQLDKLGLNYTVSGSEDTVTDQSPAAGIALQKANTVVLYCGDKKSTKKVKVPSVRGMSIEEAQYTLEQAGFYMKQNGVKDTRVNVATSAIYQNPQAKSKAEPGTVVSVAFGNAVTSEE